MSKKTSKKRGGKKHKSSKLTYYEWVPHESGEFGLYRMEQKGGTSQKLVALVFPISTPVLTIYVGVQVRQLRDGNGGHFYFGGTFANADDAKTNTLRLIRGMDDAD